MVTTMVTTMATTMVTTNPTRPHLTPPLGRVIEQCEQRMNEDQMNELLELLDEVLGPVQSAEYAEMDEDDGGVAGEGSEEGGNEDDPGNAEEPGMLGTGDPEGV